MNVLIFLEIWALTEYEINQNCRCGVHRHFQNNGENNFLFGYWNPV